jgi:hypothetical protein
MSAKYGRIKRNLAFHLLPYSILQAANTTYICVDFIAKFIYNFVIY